MNDLRFDIYIAAKPDAVWRALTSPEGVAALYFGSRLETTFAPGATYRYVGADGRGGETVHVEGEILACEPNALFQLTHRAGPIWRKDGRAFTSRVAYRLADLGWATKLTVEHDRWQDGDPAHANVIDGWPIFLSSVKSWVETGRALAMPMH